MSSNEDDEMVTEFLERLMAPSRLESVMLDVVRGMPMAEACERALESYMAEPSPADIAREHVRGMGIVDPALHTEYLKPSELPAAGDWVVYSGPREDVTVTVIGNRYPGRGGVLDFPLAAGEPRVADELCPDAKFPGAVDLPLLAFAAACGVGSETLRAWKMFASCHRGIDQAQRRREAFGVVPREVRMIPSLRRSAGTHTNLRDARVFPLASRPRSDARVDVFAPPGFRVRNRQEQERSAMPGGPPAEWETLTLTMHELRHRLRDLAITTGSSLDRLRRAVIELTGFDPFFEWREPAHEGEQPGSEQWMHPSGLRGVLPPRQT